MSYPGNKENSTPSFVLTLKLDTGPAQEKILSHRFFLGCQMYNKLVSHAQKRIRGLRQDRQYRELMTEYISLKGSPDKDRRAAISMELKDIRENQYGLSQFQFEKWLKVQQAMCKKHIDSQMAQKIVARVWEAASDCLFSKGKKLHHRKNEEFTSMEGKSNTTGLKYRDGHIQWLGLNIRALVKKNDRYAEEALTHRVKFCKIIRKAMGTSYHYYVQLVLEGIPPQKFIPAEGRVGIDPGVSTEAVVSRHGCLLQELSLPEKDSSYAKERRILRKMDRSRRSVNPECYNADGTVKKRHARFKKSGHYKKLAMKLKTLRRKRADHSRQMQEGLASKILREHGSTVITEKMTYKGLQAKAEKASVNSKTGRYRSRKRYGSSIANNAPARFLTILERKLGYRHLKIHYVNTAKYRASQYRHDTDSYERHGLNERAKRIRGRTVQRDLYSAFLLMNAFDARHPDRIRCHRTFRKFYKHMTKELQRLLQDNAVHPTCMGLRDFRGLIRTA